MEGWLINGKTRLVNLETKTFLSDFLIVLTDIQFSLMFSLEIVHLKTKTLLLLMPSSLLLILDNHNNMFRKFHVEYLFYFSLPPKIRESQQNTDNSFRYPISLFHLLDIKNKYNVTLSENYNFIQKNQKGLIFHKSAYLTNSRL